MSETTVLEGKDSPYAKRLGEYTGALMRDNHRHRNALLRCEMLAMDIGYEARKNGDKELEELALATERTAREALREYGKKGK